MIGVHTVGYPALYAYLLRYLYFGQLESLGADVFSVNSRLHTLRFLFVVPILVFTWFIRDCELTMRKNLPIKHIHGGRVDRHRNVEHAT